MGNFISVKMAWNEKKRAAKNHVVPLSHKSQTLPFYVRYFVRLEFVTKLRK